MIWQVSPLNGETTQYPISPSDNGDVFFVTTLDGDVDVELGSPAQMIAEDSAHGTLMSNSNILQVKGHHDVAVHPLYIF